MLILDFFYSRWKQCAWVTKCLVKVLFLVNAWPQMLHWNGLSPVCLFLCVFKCAICMKPRPQILHLNGLSPVWIVSCLFFLWIESKGFLQNWHGCEFENSLLLLWILMCICLFLIESKDLLQMSQWCDFGDALSIVWILSWLLKSTGLPKALGQSWHWKCFTSEWFFEWISKSLSVKKLFEQDWQCTLNVIGGWLEIGPNYLITVIFDLYNMGQQWDMKFYAERERLSRSQQL